MRTTTPSVPQKSGLQRSKRGLRWGLRKRDALLTSVFRHTPPLIIIRGILETGKNKPHTRVYKKKNGSADTRRTQTPRARERVVMRRRTLEGSEAEHSTHAHSEVQEEVFTNNGKLSGPSIRICSVVNFHPQQFALLKRKCVRSKEKWLLCHSAI